MPARCSGCVSKGAERPRPTPSALGPGTQPSCESREQRHGKGRLDRLTSLPSEQRGRRGRGGPTGPQLQALDGPRLDAEFSPPPPCLPYTPLETGTSLPEAAGQMPGVTPLPRRSVDAGRLLSAVLGGTLRCPAVHQDCHLPPPAALWGLEPTATGPQLPQRSGRMLLSAGRTGAGRWEGDGDGDELPPRPCQPQHHLAQLLKRFRGN